MVRRAKFADGSPKPLPKPERSFQDKLKTLKNVSQGISPESRIRLLDYFIQEALTKGQLTQEQASGIYNQLQLDKDKIRKQIDDYERENFAEGSMDFSGLSVPQLRLLYKRYTGVDGPRDSRQLIRELKRLIKGLDEDGIPFNEGGRAKLAVGAIPFIPTAVAAARPFAGPLLRKGAEVIGGTALGKRLSDTFFSKEEDEDKKEIVPSDDKNNLNLKRGDDPGDPDPLDEITERLLIEEAVNRLKKKEMDPGKRDNRTALARNLDLPVTRSGMLEVRKGDYFNKRLQTLKDKGVNFDGYFSIPEIANLIGSKSSSGIQSYINDKKIPTVKQGLYKVVKLNDFLNVYEGTKKRVDLTPPESLANQARGDFLKEVGGNFYQRFKDMRRPKFLPPEVKEIYEKYSLGEIEGGHPFPVEFFTKKFGKNNTLQKTRQIDWIYRNKDKLFDKNDLVFQSTEVNKFYKTKIGELKKLYKELAPLVDQYEGKGPVTNKKDIKTIESLNNKIMDVIAKAEFDAKKFIEESPNAVDLKRMSKGGLHGALFNTDTGEVSLYAPGKEAGFVEGSVGEIKTEDGVVPGEKLKLGVDYLDIINNIITDETDRKIFTNYLDKDLLPRFQKGGPVYGKYAGQIAKLP